MQGFNKVLVVCNDAHDTLTLTGQLRTLFGETGAEITLFKVIGNAPARPIMSTPPGEISELVTAHHKHELEAVVAALRNDRLRATAKVSIGKRLPQILREATTGGYDLVVKSAERRRNDRQTVARGFDVQLLRACPQPLLLLAKDLRPQLRNVMVAIELASPQTVESDFGLKLLEMGKRISLAAGADLHVFHAWQARGEDAVHYRLGAAMANQYVGEIRLDKWRLLTGTLHRAKLSTSDTHVHFHKGKVRQLLPHFAREENIDLLLIGTVGRTGVSAGLFGNTSEKVLPQIETPVLAIKPDSFVSTVTFATGDLDSGGARAKDGIADLQQTANIGSTRSRLRKTKNSVQSRTRRSKTRTSRSPSAETPNGSMKHARWQDMMQSRSAELGSG